MRTITTLLLILALSLRAFAQDKKVTFGPIQTIMGSDIGFAEIEAIGEHNGNIYYMLYPFSMYMSNVVGTNKNVQIARLSSGLVFEMAENIIPEYEGQEMEYEFFKMINGEIYVFSSFQNKKQKKTYLFAQSVDKTSLRLNDNLKMITSVDYSAENNYKRSNFELELSPDKSKLLVTYSLLNKDNTLIRYGLNVLDSKFNNIYSIDNVDFPTQGLYSFLQYRLDNKGNVYLLTKYFEDKREFKDHTEFKKNWILSGTRTLEMEANHAYKIVKFTESAGTRQYDLKLADYVIPTLDFVVADDQTLSCQGFISSPGLTSAIGNCFFKINTTNGEVTSTVNTWNRDFILQGMDDKEANKALKTMDKDENFEDYILISRDIKQRKDGGFYHFAEKTKTETKTVNSAGQISTVVVYYYRDIIVTNYDKNGKVLWVKKVPKVQDKLADMGYFMLSFGHHVDDQGNIAIVYVNLGKSNATMLGAWKKTSSQLFTITSSGQTSSQEIFNSDDDTVTLKARRSYITKDGDLILFGVKSGNKYRFGKLDL